MRGVEYASIGHDRRGAAGETDAADATERTQLGAYGQTSRVAQRNGCLYAAPEVRGRAYQLKAPSFSVRIASSSVTRQREFE